MLPVEIREESIADAAAIDELLAAAFGGDEEVRVVQALRANGGVSLSLVAVDAGVIVGHVLFSPVEVSGRSGGVALGPMAVTPSHQRKGIGSTLVGTGIERLRQRGVPFVVVLGHLEYYPRFGFMPALEAGVECQWDVPPGVFMVMPLAGEVPTGRCQFRPEFG